MIEINSDQEEVTSNILCKGGSINSGDFYYLNFINEIVDHSDYSFIKEDKSRYTDCFIMPGNNSINSDELNAIVFIDMLNKVSVTSSIRYKDIVLGDDNILFSIKNGNNTICVRLDDRKALVLDIETKKAKVIGQVELSSYIHCK